MSYTLTGANSQYAITIPGVYNAPQTLKGYAADDAFETEDQENAEVLMGIDGILSGGFVYKEVGQVITLQANSPSYAVFNNWALAQKAGAEVITANAVIQLPAIGGKYNLAQGYLTRFKPIPGVKKLLQPVSFRIVWNTVQGIQLPPSS
jgi:hypothetical protein